jgi:hypothetical protein
VIPGATRDITATGARPNTRRFQRSAKENLARVARFPDRVMRRKSSTAHAVRLFCCIRSSTLEIRGSVAGGIAQLVERQLCKLDVRGSNPLASILLRDKSWAGISEKADNRCQRVATRFYETPCTCHEGTEKSRKPFQSGKSRTTRSRSPPNPWPYILQK